ncbi:MAG: HEAT repeat domain-containing protein [Planctomycetes bacterium]|nr:HEAT repeat domain-containing protein [Planctomycetota bacterium]
MGGKIGATMRGIQTTFRTLLADGSELAFQAALEGLLEDDLNVCQEAAAALVEWGRDEGYAATIRVYGKLGEETKKALRDLGPRLKKVLRDCFHDPNRQVRETASSILIEMGLKRLVSLASVALVEEPMNREKISREIVNLARENAEAFARDGGTQKNRVDREELRNVIEAALRTGHLHGVTGPIEAAFEIAPFADDLLLGALSHVDDSGNWFRETLPTIDCEGLGGFLFRAFLSDEDNWRKDAIIAMRHCRSAKALKGLEKEFANRPASDVSARILEAGDVPYASMIEAGNAKVSEEFSLAHADMISKLSIPPAKKIEMLKVFMLGAKAPTIRKIIEQARALNRSSVNEVVSVASSVDSPEVQLAALEFIDDKDFGKMRTALASFLNSPFEAVRQRASMELMKHRRRAFLDSFDGMDEHSRRVAGEAIAKSDEGFAKEIAADLHAVEESQRLRALKIITTIKGEAGLREEIVSLMKDPSRLIRAYTVNLLTAFGTPDALKALLSALSDSDRRVKANAIEALESLGNPKVKSVLEPFLRHQDNRVRANAAKALYNLGNRDALKTFDEMIADDDELMRLSGVWGLAEAVGEECRAKLEAVSTSDPSEKVRAKATEFLSGFGDGKESKNES